MKHTVFIMCVLFAICCSGCGTKKEIPKESVDMETTKATEDTDADEQPWKPKVWEEGNSNPEKLIERFF